MAYLYGRNTVREAMRAGRAIARLYVAGGAKAAGALGESLAAAQRQGIPVVAASSAALDRMAGGGNHQGIVAEVADFYYTALEDLLAKAAAGSGPGVLLLLDHLSDPQNLGALLRTAEAVGAMGVIIPRERAAGITPAVEKASAGAVEHLPVAQVVNLARTIEALKERAFWVYGLDGAATQEYDRTEYSFPLALVVGSEGRGLSRLAREKCDLLIKLPMRGRIESLNAAVAGSIVLYHMWRSRQVLGHHTDAK